MLDSFKTKIIRIINNLIFTLNNYILKSYFFSLFERENSLNDKIDFTM